MLLFYCKIDQLLHYLSFSLLWNQDHPNCLLMGIHKCSLEFSCENLLPFANFTDCNWVFSPEAFLESINSLWLSLLTHAYVLPYSNFFFIEFKAWVVTSFLVHYFVPCMIFELVAARKNLQVQLHQLIEQWIGCPFISEEYLSFSRAGSCSPSLSPYNVLKNKNIILKSGHKILRLNESWQDVAYSCS